MDKAPDAFRTISEVADDLDIPQHVLRFWETRFTQIKPMKRSGGRRYYRPDDVDLLRGIRRLLYGEGYTIRGVQRILKENGIKSVQGLVDGSVAPSFAPAAAASPRVALKRPLVQTPEEDPETEEAELEDEFEDEAEAEELDGDDVDAENAAGKEPEDDEGETEEQDEPAESVAAPAVSPRRAPDIVARREPPMTSAPSVRVEPSPQRPPSRANPVLARPEPVLQTPPRQVEMPNPPPAPPIQRPPLQRRLERERLEAVLDELLAARQALDTAMKDG